MATWPAGGALGLVVLAASLACGDARRPADDAAETARDVGATAVTDAADTAAEIGDVRDVPLDALDEATSVASWSIASRYRVVLDDGRTFEGQLIATYDHREWWGQPSQETTLALFDPDRYADWPDDRSVVFVAASAVVARELLDQVGSGAPGYRDWLAERGFAWRRLPLEGVAYVMAGNERHHLNEDGYGDFAYDLGFADDEGARWSGDGLALEDYFSWDAPVFAPVGGTVVELVRDAPDRAPGGAPDDLTLPENLVGLWLGGSWHAYLLHFRHDTVASELVVGDLVEEGRALGRIGNSGTSVEPHLHLALLYWDHERSRYWSVPVDFLDVFVATGPDGAHARARFAPLGGTFMSSSPF